MKRAFIVPPEAVGARLDRWLAAQLPELSRTRIQELMEEGRVRIGGRAAKASHRLAAEETIEAEIVPRPALDAAPEEIPLEILYEDEDLVVVNKPAGMVVHAGAGVRAGTLVNALLHRYGRLSKEGGAVRPGIVHRLDRGTSGAIIVARTDRAHRALAEQFRRREIGKTYVALVHGHLSAPSGTIGLPIARDLRQRKRMTARRGAGREARTDWRVAGTFDGFTLVEVALHTGRTHQIRVHFSALRHPVVGDALYGAPREIRIGRQTLPPLGRNFLHAARIAFQHPVRGGTVEVRAPLPAELRGYLSRLGEALGMERERIDALLKAYL